MPDVILLGLPHRTLNHGSTIHVVQTPAMSKSDTDDDDTDNDDEDYDDTNDNDANDDEDVEDDADDGDAAGGNDSSYVRDNCTQVA